MQGSNAEHLSRSGSRSGTPHDTRPAPVEWWHTASGTLPHGPSHRSSYDPGTLAGDPLLLAFLMSRAEDHHAAKSHDMSHPHDSPSCLIIHLCQAVPATCAHAVCCSLSASGYRDGKDIKYLNWWGALWQAACSPVPDCHSDKVSTNRFQVCGLSMLQTLILTAACLGYGKHPALQHCVTADPKPIWRSQGT